MIRIVEVSQKRCHYLIHMCRESVQKEGTTQWSGRGSRCETSQQPAAAAPAASIAYVGNELSESTDNFSKAEAIFTTLAVKIASQLFLLGFLTVDRLTDLFARIDPKSAEPINRRLSSYRPVTTLLWIGVLCTAWENTNTTSTHILLTM